jgi:hypothetical protein
MPVVTPPSVSALPTPPSTASPSTFDSRADAFLGALPTFQTENNALAANVFANATDAAASASSAASTGASQVAAATAQAVIATNQATIAVGAVATSGAVAWNAATNYSIGNVVYSPINLANYRRRTNGVTANDPSLDTTNWGPAVDTIGRIPVNSLLPFPNETANLVTTAEGGTYLRTGVTAAASTYPLAISEVQPLVNVDNFPGIGSANTPNVAFGNGIFVRVNIDTTFYPLWSTDGIVWTVGTGSGGLINSAHGVFFIAAQNKFVLIQGDATNLTVLDSTDGKVWSQVTTVGVTANGMFGSAVDSTGRIMVYSPGVVLTVYVSTDYGVSWNTQTTPITAGNSVRPIAFGNGIFVAASPNINSYATSTNGTTWTARTLPTVTPGISTSLVFVGGYFWVNSGGTAGLHRSTDGIGWTTTTPSGFNNTNTYALTVLGSTFILMQVNNLWTSTDAGVTWTARAANSPTNGLTSITVLPCEGFTNGTTAYIRYNSANFGLPRSTDGINWSWYASNYFLGSDSVALRVTSDGAGRFLKIPPNATDILTSSDGVQWTARLTALSISPANWKAACIVNGLYIALPGDNNGTQISTSANGISWTTRTVTAPGAAANYGYCAYGAGNWLLVPTDTTSTQAVSSTDGATWTSRTLSLSGNYRGVVFVGGKFIAVASSGLSSTQCTGAPSGTWSTVAIPINPSGIVATSTRALIWTDSQRRAFTSTDGVTWMIVNMPTSTGSIEKMIATSSLFYMKVSTGGWFSSADGLTWTAYCNDATGLVPLINAAGDGLTFWSPRSVSYQLLNRVKNATAIAVGNNHIQYLRVA